MTSSFANQLNFLKLRAFFTYRLHPSSEKHLSEDIDWKGRQKLSLYPKHKLLICVRNSERSKSASIKKNRKQYNKFKTTKDFIYINVLFTQVILVRVQIMLRQAVLVFSLVTVVQAWRV